MPSPVTPPSTNHAQDLIDIFNGQTGAVPVFGTPKPLFTEVEGKDSDQYVEIKPTCELPKEAEKIFQFKTEEDKLVWIGDWEVDEGCERDNGSLGYGGFYCHEDVSISNIRILKKSTNEFRIDFNFQTYIKATLGHEDKRDLERTKKSASILLDASGMHYAGVFPGVWYISPERFVGVLRDKLQFYADEARNSFACPGLFK